MNIFSKIYPLRSYSNQTNKAILTKVAYNGEDYSINIYVKNKISISSMKRQKLQRTVDCMACIAYTLTAQKTVIKRPMLILFTEDNSSMSYEEMHVQIFSIFCHHCVEIEVSVGLGSKFHEY